MSQATVLELVRTQLLPAFWKERERLDRIDKWLRWECEPLEVPREGNSREIKALAELSKTPILSLIVATLAQELSVESYRTTDPKKSDAPAWSYWLANKMPARQYPLHHAAIAYGHAYTWTVPGLDPLTGASMPVIRGKSPRKFLALYRDLEGDDWPEMTIEVDPQPGGKALVFVSDDEDTHRLSAPFVSQTDGPIDGEVEYIDYVTHGVGVCPAVRYSTFVDLDGRSDGRVEPFIGTAKRAQKTMFDRLLIQHFNSWKVKTISGIDLDNKEGVPASEAEIQRRKLRLSMDSMLVGADKDTKFGSLPETDVTPVTAAYKSDIETLATVSQTPTHTLTGDLINLSADAIKESRISLEHLAGVSKLALGESHKQTLGLAAFVNGDAPADPTSPASVGWADTDSRSLAQAADALGKLKLMGVPLEMLLEDIPGWDQDKVERAVRIIEEGGDSLDKLIAELDKQTAPGGGQQAAPAGAGSGANAGG